MNPITVVTGIMLGTSLSIFAGLAVVGLIFLIISPETPRVAPEVGPLLRALALFFGLTAVCAVSFIGQVRTHRWRWLAQGAMWAAIAATVWAYLPD